MVVAIWIDNIPDATSSIVLPMSREWLSHGSECDDTETLVSQGLNIRSVSAARSNVEPQRRRVGY